MIYVNKPMPEQLPDKTIILLSNDYKNIIVQTPETNIQKLKKEVEGFIIKELEKARKQAQIYNTIVNTLTKLLEK